MTTVVDVSSKLGEYMLKGYVLTDIICSKCSKVPLMRSSTSSVEYFCVNCDEGPSATGSSVRPDSGLPHVIPAADGVSEPTSLSDTDQSRLSTPLTQLSSHLDSPRLAPVDLEESLRRRRQSDYASAEIGSRLLKGWAMLADECPNPQCFGIPLLRPPKPGGQRDPRKECVVCHHVYITQVDANGFSSLVRHGSVSDAISPGGQPSGAVAQPPSNAGAPSRINSPPTMLPTGLPSSTPSSTLPRVSQSPPTNATLATLRLTAASLETSLGVLAERLANLSKSPTINTPLIGQTADAIGKVSQALMHVKQLQWSESHAHVT